MVKLPQALRMLLYTIEQRAPRLAALLILLVVSAGGLYSLQLGNELRFLPDESDYLALVDHMLQTGSYTLDGSTPSAYRAPGYPFWLLPFRAAGADVQDLRWSNYLALGVTLAALYLLLARLQNRWAGLLAVILSCGYAVLFYTAGTLYPQTLAGMLFVLVLYLLVGGQFSGWRMAAAGLLLGWLVLTMPVFAFALPLLALWLLWVKPRPTLVQLGVFLGTAALVVGAWTARNWLVFGAFIPVATNSGENLLVGNSARSVANAGRTVSFADYEELTEDMNEIERDRFYRQEALAFIRGQPTAAARLYVEKVLNYFNYRNDLVTQVGGLSLANLVMLLTYGPLLLLGLVRLVLARRFPLNRFEWLLVILYLLSALATAVFFTRIRFRLPFDYALILLDAGFFERMLRQTGLTARTGGDRQEVDTS